MHAENVHVPDWNAVQEAVSQTISQSSDPFDRATIANVHDLIDACRNVCTVPEDTGKGYWSTICFYWGDVEVEVCVDHYEFYDLGQGRMNIQHFSHTPGTSVPVVLIDLLPKLSPFHD